MPTGRTAGMKRVTLKTQLRPVVPILPATLVLAMLALTGVGLQPVLSGRNTIPLPSASGKALGSGAWHVLRLELGSGGAPLLHLDGHAHTHTSLPEALQRLVAAEPDAQLRIQANTVLPFQEVQQAALMAQTQGVARVVLEVKQADTARAAIPASPSSAPLQQSPIAPLTTPSTQPGNPSKE